MNSKSGYEDKADSNDFKRKVPNFIDFLTFDRIAFSIGGIVLGLVIGAVWMHDNNREQKAYLDQQHKYVSQELDNVMAMKQLSGAELRNYIATVHEQSRIARNLQERLHEQELALTGAESKIIHLVIATMVITAFAVLRINKSINERARITIENAIGLPSAKMRENLTKSQIVAASSVSEVAMSESSKKQRPKISGPLQDRDENRHRLSREEWNDGYYDS